MLIEKDREKYTEKGLPTPPEELRPISLGNTDAKHTSSSLARPLVLVADTLISKTQEGFVKGRQMVRNVLRLEAFGKALTFHQQFACFLFS